MLLAAVSLRLFFDAGKRSHYSTVIDMGDAMGTACALAKRTSTPLAKLDGVSVRAEAETNGVEFMIAAREL